MVGMGDINERVGTLSQIAAKQVGDSKLGDNVVYVCASGHNATTLLQIGNNLRNSTCCCRRQSDDWLTLPVDADGGTTDKVHLTSDTYTMH